MAINPIPNVIDIGSAEHAQILTDYYAGDTDVVYEPVEMDTGTDQSSKIQAYLNLLEDGKPKDSVTVLQFPIGGIISVNRTLLIPRCAGPELRGGGYKFSEEPYLSATTTITAMGPYTETDGVPDGFVDPYWVDPDPGGPDSIPNNLKPPIMRARYTVGLSIRGIALDGKDQDIFTGDGFQMIAASGSSVNAAKHRYEMMAIRNCNRGWSHDQYSPEANSNAGDTFHFNQCMFERCNTAAYFDSPMDLQSYFNIVGFNYCGIGVEVYQAGQIRLHHVTLVATHTLVQASRMESNNRHLYINGLKCDLNNSAWRPTIFKEVDLDTNADGSTSPSTRVGGTRGNVTLSDMMFAEGIGDLSGGDVISVSDVGGKARFLLSSDIGNTFPLMVPGRHIGMPEVMSNSAYKLDESDGTGQSWIVHEITAINKVGESPGRWEVDTDTDYAGDATGEWLDVTPMIIQTGGSAVTIKESFIGKAWRGYGRLAWMTTGNYGPSTISALLFVVRCEAATLTGREPSYYIREMTAPNTGESNPWNFWKFIDCWGVWDRADPPWSRSNYSTEDGMDWTDTEREQIRRQLGIDGTQTPPAAIPAPGSMAGNVRHSFAAVAGETEGIGTASEVFNDADDDPALTVAYDTNGNRTVVYS